MFTKSSEKIFPFLIAQFQKISSFSKNSYYFGSYFLF